MQAQDDNLQVPGQGTPVIIGVDLAQLELRVIAGIFRQQGKTQTFRRLYGTPITALIIDDLVHPIDTVLEELSRQEMAQLVASMQPIEAYEPEPAPLKYHERFNTGRVPKFNSIRQRHRR